VARVFTTYSMFSGNKAFVGTGVEKVRDQREELASNNMWRTERCSMYTYAEMNSTYKRGGTSYTYNPPSLCVY
jgi:hypothetical protein